MPLTARPHDLRGHHITFLCSCFLLVMHCHFFNFPAFRFWPRLGSTAILFRVVLAKSMTSPLTADCRRRLSVCAGERPWPPVPSCFRTDWAPMLSQPVCPKRHDDKRKFELCPPTHTFSPSCDPSACTIRSRSVHRSESLVFHTTSTCFLRPFFCAHLFTKFIIFPVFRYWIPFMQTRSAGKFEPGVTVFQKVVFFLLFRHIYPRYNEAA